MRLDRIVAIIGLGALLGLLGTMNPGQAYAPFLMFAGMIVLLVGTLIAALQKEAA